MDKYISLDRIKEVFDYAEQEFCECDYAVKNTREAVESLPAADVQPVRHGRWVTREVLVNPIDGIWRTLVECSECGGEAFKHEVYGYQRDNFCHLCGADLREIEK